MTSAEATKKFTVLNVLSKHTGEILTPDTIEAITREFMYEMSKGSTSWAFREE